MADATSMDELVSALGVLLLRRQDDDSFRVEGRVPYWCLRLFPDAGLGTGSPFPVVERFPFVESFLPTARNYWGTRKMGRIRSGYWVETNPSGDEVPLQASALCLEEGDYLLVESVKGSFEREKGLLQTAREKTLSHDEAMSLRERARDLQRRNHALQEALGDRLVRVHRDGSVAGGAAVPADVAAEIARLGGESLRSGTVQTLRHGDYAGRVTAVSDDEIWAVLD